MGSKGSHYFTRIEPQITLEQIWRRIVVGRHNDLGDAASRTHLKCQVFSKEYAFAILAFKRTAIGTSYYTMH
jgi:hypothetical protein